MGVTHMTADALDIGVAFNEVLEHLILLFIAGLERYAIFPVALAVVIFVLPQVVRLNAQQHIHIGQALGAIVPGLLPGPQLGAEVAVEAGNQPQFLGSFQAIENKVGTAGTKGGRNAGHMEPGKAGEQFGNVHLAQVVLGNGGVLPVIGHLAGPDAVAGFQVVGAQPMGGGFLRGGQDYRGAVNVIGAEHPDGALADGVVGNHGEEGGVDAQVGQGKGDVGFTAAVGGLKFIGHADFLIIGGRKTEHDFADGNELMLTAGIGQKRIVMFHGWGSFP